MLYIKNTLLVGLIIIITTISVRFAEAYKSISEGQKSVERASQFSYEYYNDSLHMDIARKIGNIVNIEQVSVISLDDLTLIGIIVNDAFIYDTKNIEKETIALINRCSEFNNDVKIVFDLEEAEKIIELSEYVDKGIDMAALSARFMYLWENKYHE